MYEKKINIFNDEDRKIYNIAFKYNFMFFVILLMIVFSLILWKKDYYYQNIINFLDNKKALIFVNKDYIKEVTSKNSLLINNIDFKYNINKIEEKEDGYILSIDFNKEINIKTNLYKILLRKESLLEYIVRIMKGV